MSVKLSEMSWPEVKEVLQRNNVVVIPLGSTEQHGTHLPLNVDHSCAAYMAETAAEKAVSREQNVDVLVAPTLPYTYAAVHKMFPGTVGIKLETLIHVLIEITESFLEQGFSNIILFTTHAQNACPMEAALQIVSERWPKARLVGLSSLALGSKARAGSCKAGPAGLGHALEAETSMTMVLQPHLVHLDRAIKGSRQLPLSEKHIGPVGFDRSKGVLYYNGVTGFETSGIQGDPSLASPEEGEKLLAGITDDLADIILEVAMGQNKNE